MTHHMRYQFELTSESATLYLAGGIARHDAPALMALCDALPRTVRTLRLDLRAIGAVSAEALEVVRRLLRHWGASRRGEFRLSTSHLVATYQPAEPTTFATAGASESWAMPDAALAATYL